jgi:hypothetical protein
LCKSYNPQSDPYIVTVLATMSLASSTAVIRIVFTR